MSLLPTIGAVDQDTGFYNGVATQSLRFDDGSSSSITREFVTPTNLNKWTINLWVKRGNINTLQEIISGDYVDITFIGLRFLATNTLEFLQYSSGGGVIICDLITTQVFRDTSAWYNIQINHDTSASGDDRQQIWVNGVKITSYSTGTRSSNSGAWNRSGVNYHFGKLGISGQESYFDGYMSEINCVDGLNLDPSYFGETKNGVWIAKNPVVSDYGNNGFRLQFKNTGTGTTSEGTTATTNIGDDSSGNGHNFSVSGINSHDCVSDSPENNFCTLNPLQISNNDSNFFPSEGNLKLTVTNNSGYRNCSSTFSPMGLKGYFEFMVTGTANSYIGIIEDTTHPTNADYADSSHQSVLLVSNGRVEDSNSEIRSASDFNLGTIAVGDVLGVAFDFTGTNRNLWFHRANTYGTASGGVGNPATGANPIATSSNFDSTRDFRFHLGANTGGAATSLHLNFGQNPSFNGELTGGDIGTTTDANGNGLFKYAPPSGFLALCSANLEEPTIGPNADTQAVNHFGTLTYTGTDADGRTITSGDSNIGGEISFTPDWVWVKARNASGNYHLLFDSSRSATKMLFSNDTSDEVTQADSLSAFNTNGFTVSDNAAAADMNASAHTYVAWNWKANGGTTTTNDASATSIGSIDSVIQANTTAGFSIVTFASNNTAGNTVAHGLGVAPKMIITKARTQTSAWYTYHYNVGAGNYLVLNTTAASASSSGLWGNTHPTSTVFTIGTNDAGFNDGTANGSIAYCFAEVEGYSKFGSYTGNGLTTATNSNGTFAFLGFRPAFIMIKNTSAAAEWVMIDSVRSTFNEVDKILSADSTSDEDDFVYANRNIDFLSNGFKIRNTAAGGSTALNTSGSVYIYMAFAEAPFKYANAR